MPAVSIPLQHTAFMVNAATCTKAELDEVADEGARVFLAAYGVQRNSP
jgi:TetR/AcrR family transcriptional regulator, mexJK operon transcriptional repressor